MRGSTPVAIDWTGTVATPIDLSVMSGQVECDWIHESSVVGCLPM